MPDRINRQWTLARRPQGAVRAEDFRLVEGPAPTPSDGEVLVRNLLLSCDPTQRGWMAADTYLPAVRIGEVMRAFARCAPRRMGSGWPGSGRPAPGDRSR